MIMSAVLKQFLNEDNLVAPKLEIATGARSVCASDLSFCSLAPEWKTLCALPKSRDFAAPHYGFTLR
jgi:hypothetical protein